MLDDRTKALVKRIRSEANIADRPGQYDRLQEIADDLKKLEPMTRTDEREKVKAEYVPVLMEHLRILANLRASVEAMDHDSRCGEGKPADVDWIGYCDCWRRDVLALIEGSSDE